MAKEAALAVTGVSVEKPDVLCNTGLFELSTSTGYMIRTIIATKMLQGKIV